MRVAVWISRHYGHNDYCVMSVSWSVPINGGYFSWLQAESALQNISSPSRRSWFPFRKRSMPFLTVDAIIGNQAFQNERCHICFSLGLDKVETGYNLLME